ncbi:basic proline-rich protein-like [Symphalangus syndactylus]|uniref:basic proline-rich protein-like n=1 Tax=Symphalangus syndactylus TaxID=9590 RepID=UPI0024410539|nr:basic proline-rich protein-like [Symphalangus syndactylus]
MSPGEASISCPPVPAPGRAPGLGVFAAAEDAARAAGRVFAEGGPGQPCSASQRSPGGRAAPPNMIQNRPSALAPVPGASEPGLAVSAPSEPCGPRARAGRDPPRQDPADPAACLPPGPDAHGPRLQHQGCAAGSAAGSAPGTRGSLHSSRRTPCLNPKRTGPGASQARPEPQPQNSPPPTALPLCAVAGVGDWGRRKETRRSSSLLSHFGSGRAPQGSSRARFQIVQLCGARLLRVLGGGSLAAIFC